MPIKQFNAEMGKIATAAFFCADLRLTRHSFEYEIFADANPKASNERDFCISLSTPEAP